MNETMILWFGIKLSKKQREIIKKAIKKDGIVKIFPEGILGLEILGRKVKFKDLVGKIEVIKWKEQE